MNGCLGAGACVRETDRAREWAIKAGTFYRVHVLNLVTGVDIAAGSESLKAGWG